MSARAVPARAWLKWGLGFSIWTLIGLSFASQFYLSGPKTGLSVTWRQAILWALGDWYVFAILSLPVLWLVRHFRLEGARWRGNVVVHLAASVLFSLLYMVLRAWVAQFQSWMDDTPVTFADAINPLLVKTFHFNLLIYWVIISVSHAFDYYRQSQDRALRAAELEKRLAQAKLQALQMQLNPHFLFNTLHAISSLMHKDVEAADRMLARLSDLLRTSLDRTDEHEVPLRQDLEFLRRYLEIEQTRFGDRLTVQFEIAPDVTGVMVPNLLLQPLVENAIKHGIERQARPGQISIRARRADGRLRLEVQDNGPGMPNGRPPRVGVGLSNTRERLQELYREDHKLEFAPAPNGGLIVNVWIPLRDAGIQNS